MKTIIIALISTLVMFNGANAQIKCEPKLKPYFVFQLGDFKPGLLLQDDVKRIRDLRVFSRCPLHEGKNCCGILEFKLVLINIDGKKFEIINKGPYLNPNVLYFINQAKVGDEIVLAGVAVKCHDRVINLPIGLKYKIVKKP